MPSKDNWGCCPYPNAVCCGDYTCCPAGTTCQNSGSDWRVTSTCVAANGTKVGPGADGGGQEVCKTGGPLPFSTTLKNVVILGDSVSIGYTPHVATHLASKALVQHSPWGGDGGAEETAYGWKCLKFLLSAPDGTPQSPDVLFFNFGLHNTGSGTLPGQAGPVAEYAPYLDKIAQFIVSEKIATKVLFGITTPQMCSATTDAVVMSNNKAAKAIMDKYNIPTVDLHAAITGVCGPAPNQTCFGQKTCFCPHCPQANGVGYEFLASKVIGPAIEKLLGQIGLGPSTRKMTSELLKETKGNVGILTLNRPDKLNAWTGPMATALFDGMKAFEADPNVGVIVVTGAGRGFCAGADMGGLSSLSTGAPGTLGGGQDAPPPDNRTVIFTTTIKKPVIAAINGPCAGIGLSFALACDFRFSVENAKFTLAFSRRGLVAEHGASWTLPRLLGTGNAMMFAMSGDVITGEEAYRMGMVQKLCDDNVLGLAVEYAQHLCDNVSPTSMAAMKQQLWNHPTLGIEEATRQSMELMRSSLQPANADFTEGVSSFMEKRPPAFAPLDKNNPVMKLAESYFSKL
eukprot:g703.t1